jgi:hypothetical protein
MGPVLSRRQAESIRPDHCPGTHHSSGAPERCPSEQRTLSGGGGPLAALSAGLLIVNLNLQPKTTMTPEQQDKISSLVRRQLIYDITNEPEFWADWIIEQTPNQTDWLVEYLDLDNLHDEDRIRIIDELGFDPRTAA